MAAAPWGTSGQHRSDNISTQGNKPVCTLLIAVCALLCEQTQSQLAITGSTLAIGPILGIVGQCKQLRTPPDMQLDVYRWP